MKVSYKKLWKMLIDQDMKKRDLEKAAGMISLCQVDTQNN